MVPAAALVIRELTAADLPAAAETLGRAMRDNPLHVRAYGPDPDRREGLLARQFSASLPRQLDAGGAILGAFDRREPHALLGAAAFVPPGRCRPSAASRVRSLPALFGSHGITRAWRTLVWAYEWSRRDPETTHWHLGPVGVDRHRQGHGIGTMLLRAFSERMDALEATAYLETDRLENVPFYERFGFQVVADGTVLGVPNWFMIRTG
ncbi:MAG TPA: GNAT family N-acetyltransferase [Vicinamibacterales bacterium]|nr:GNAT family N-acetyltransferase [Vicinamibacterales bacterium]